METIIIKNEGMEKKGNGGIELRVRSEGENTLDSDSMTPGSPGTYIVPTIVMSKYIPVLIFSVLSRCHSDRWEVYSSQKVLFIFLFLCAKVHCKNYLLLIPWMYNTV